MNNMRKMALLLLLAAASNSATAQNEVIRLQAGQAFTLHSRVEAVGTGLPPKYQWYRDGSPIEGATSPDYTIPAGQAVGSNVEFKRAAYTDGCAERMFTNTITITWCNLLINGVCWADANVAQPGTFAPRPDMYTEFYQWNQPNKAWPATGSVTGWITGNNAPSWTATPCPEGWRLPTRTEIQRLHNAGHTYATAGTRGLATGINGRFYGPNHATCSLPNTMTGCVFLSASGGRAAADGEPYEYGTGGNFWTSTPGTATTTGYGGYQLYFTPTASGNNTVAIQSGRSVRCVQ